ncbi:MAG: site-specific integrase, partial [Tannerella sp.]|nr:site-specific integrase [Tannerella sp.]
MMLLIEKYIKYLRYEKNYSLHTEISYSKDLSQFSEFLSLHFPDVDIKSVDNDLIRMWIVSLMEDGISPRSVNRKLSALKSFYKYLLRIGEVSANPMKKITGPKNSKPIPAFINNSDMEKILDEPVPEDGFEALRNRTMIELFYVTGIRRAELLGLKDIDVDFSSKTIQVTGKRNKQRLIRPGIGRTCFPVIPLGRQIDIRAKQSNPRCNPLIYLQNPGNRPSGNITHPRFLTAIDLNTDIHQIGNIQSFAPRRNHFLNITGMLPGRKSFGR